MHCDVRNKRWRWGLGLALVLLSSTMTAAGAASPGSDPDIPSLRDARAEVRRSEARLVEATATRDQARARLSRLSSSSADLASELADARDDLRQRATGVYITGNPDETVLVLLGGADLFDASARTRILAHATEQSAAAVERYNRLKRNVDPDLVELALRLQDLDQDVDDATNAVLAARANEAEAERQAALREAEEREAEVREAAARAARAAATATSTTVAAPAPTVPPTADTVAAEAASVPGSANTAPPAPTAPPATAPPTAAPPGGPSEAQWAALRKCESSGNYRAVSASGKYRGAYQFDYRTWAGLGPSGDPAAASPAEQDARAKLLYAQRGWRPWPVCGRFLR